MANREEGVAAPNQRQGQEQPQPQDAAGQRHIHLNCSNLKPEFLEKPEEDAEAHFTVVGNTGWIGGLTKVAIYLTPKGGGPCLYGTGFEWYKVENYPVNWQTTQVRLTKGT